MTSAARNPRKAKGRPRMYTTRRVSVYATRTSCWNSYHRGSALNTFVVESAKETGTHSWNFIPNRRSRVDDLLHEMLGKRWDVLLHVDLYHVLEYRSGEGDADNSTGKAD